MRAKLLYSQRGSALLTALFIMTLVAIAATAMTTRLQLDIYRTQLMMKSDKLYLSSQAVLFWAMGQLAIKEQKNQIKNKDGKLARFPKNLQQMYPDVLLQGNILDMQARFNVNNLQDKKYQPFFLRILENNLKTLNATQRKLLVNATANWINPYQPERGQDQFLDYYLKQKPTYLPSYQPMQSISEFRLVDGVNRTIYHDLLPYIIALPEITPININTAPKTILMALGNGLTADQASELIQSRKDQGITDLKEITPLLQKLDIPNEQITTESQYFLCVATATAEDFTLMRYALLKRSKDKKENISVSIISESLTSL